MAFTSIKRKLCSVPGKNLVLTAKRNFTIVRQDISGSKACRMSCLEKVAN